MLCVQHNICTRLGALNAECLQALQSTASPIVTGHYQSMPTTVMGPQSEQAGKKEPRLSSLLHSRLLALVAASGGILVWETTGIPSSQIALLGGSCSHGQYSVTVHSNRITFTMSSS